MQRWSKISKDFASPFDSKDLDMKAYKKKFEKCEEYFETKDLKLLSLLLKDPTCFSYILFRLNNDRLNLYPYQDVILNDPHRFKIFRAGRQIGKSLSLDVKAARNLVIDHQKTHNECIISKSLPQAHFQMRRVKSLLNSARFEWNKEKGSSDSMSVITFDIKDESDTSFEKQGRPQRVKYSNMLVVAPCTEGSLGYDFHEVNLDEFEYWDVDLDYFFNRIISPTVYFTKGNITIFSSPNGSDNIVSKFEKEVDSLGEPLWHTYVFDFLDCPTNSKKEWDDLKVRLSRQDFESNVAALRTSSDECFFSPEEVDRSLDKNLKPSSLFGKQPFMFLDVGAKKDQSVLTIGYVEPDKDYPDIEHLYIPIIHVYPVGYPVSLVVGSSAPNVQGWHYEKSVREYYEELSVDGISPTIGVDVTGNSGIVPLFLTVGIDPVDVTFSGPSKSGMYQRFKYYMEKGLLHRCDSKEWDRQARDLILSKGVRGHLINAFSHTKSKFGVSGKRLDARFKRIKDDCCDSTAGLISLACPHKSVRPSLRIF